MICINGEIIKSADELCDTCKAAPCPTAEYLLASSKADDGFQRTMSLVISDCQLYEEMLP
jgi:hypothetical protein